MFFHVINKNNIVALALMLGVVIFFLSANNSKLSIIDYADRHCQKNTDCLIDMNKIVPFDWDEMYIIDKGVRHKDIEDIIGAAFKGKSSLFYKIIFVRNKRVVYEDEYDPYIRSYEKKLLKPDFQYPYDGKENNFNYYTISKDNAILSMKIENKPLADDKVYYKLSPSNSQQVKEKNF
ncbi:conserved exported hypothetical protein [Xenorhabdus innexi]|uniref:Uncharacterized protein n=2 Tax=Xenorhabdus innexi TaxID=290109 RepID=A0A1N6MQU6_9GAMM|nr:hypothetical protein Xinn_03573 [Xenorhabdus innexi]SIP71212.1 conserved exported hypothetical protein [Xenorhabdus innexi]